MFACSESPRYYSLRRPNNAWELERIKLKESYRSGFSQENTELDRSFLSAFIRNIDGLLIDPNVQSGPPLMPRLAGDIQGKPSLYEKCLRHGRCEKSRSNRQDCAKKTFSSDAPAMHGKLCEQYHRAATACNRYSDDVALLGQGCCFIVEIMKRADHEKQQELRKVLNFCSDLATWYNIIIVYALGGIEQAKNLAKRQKPNTEEPYYSGQWGEPENFITCSCSKPDPCTCVQCTYEELKDDWERLKPGLQKMLLQPAHA